MWQPYLLLLLCLFGFYVDAIKPSPPLITKQPQSDEILFEVAEKTSHYDKPFLIECEAEGEPEPYYRWTKNGKPFEWQLYDDRMFIQPRLGTLFIIIPREEDIGQYQCFATNEFGTASSNSVFVRKAELNSFKEDLPQNMTALEGKPFRLQCQPPDGWPKPIVHWMKMSVGTQVLQSINNSRMTQDPEGNLWMSNVTRLDSSSSLAGNDFYYVCTAHSPIQNDLKLGNRVLLDVIQPQVTDLNKYPVTLQYVSRKNQVAIDGRRLELFCIFGGTPLPEFVWTKNGSPIQWNDRVIQGHYGKSLTIDPIRSMDEGEYTCEASNGIGQAQTYSMKVGIAALPFFTREPELVTAAEEEDATFYCEAHGKPEPNIEWIFNGKPIGDAPPNNRRIVTTNSIMVKNLVKGDTGNYGCNATNSLGYVYRDVYLNVLAVPPEIGVQPVIAATVDNRNVTLVCKVFGTPKPQVKWIKDGSNLSGGRFKVTDDGSLEITRVIPTDAGDYQCYASNKFGTKSANGTLIVKKPTKIYEHPEDYEVAAESPATFRCSAEADTHLELKINWLKNGELIDHSDSRFLKMYDNSLHISKTIELDSGEYTCVAFTDLDSDESTAMLIVQNAPNAPKLIRVECFETSATVFWESQGDNRSPILFYTIQYNTTFTPDKWNIAYEKVPSSEHTYTVTMTPWANYSFRVIAWNKIGKSLASDHSQVCTTQEDVPYKNPENVEGKGTGPDNMVIRWTQMPEIEHNAPNFHYQVSWKNDIEGETWQNTEIKNWTQTSLVIPDTPVFQRYRIKVIAINRVGQANVQAREVIGYSGEGKPTEAPEPSPPLITKQPQSDEILFEVAEKTSHYDKPFLIECEAEGEPEPYYRWTKNGKPFEWQLYDDRMFIQPRLGTLFIIIPREEDIGQYQCFATNEFGTASSNSVFVRKAELNSFKEDLPQNMTALEGKPFRLQCQPPDGWPKPIVHWMKMSVGTQVLQSINNSRMTQDPEGNLWMSNVTRLDSSSSLAGNDFYYVCTAHSPIQNDLKLGNRVLLDVIQPQVTDLNKYPVTLQYVSRKNQVAIDGRRLELFCIFGGTPLPEFVWTKNGSPIQWNDRVIQGHYGKSLTIDPIRSMDEGEYTCEASNGVGQAQTYSMNVGIAALPFFTREPELVTAVEEEDATFYCEAHGKPEPNIEWIFNGKPIGDAPPNNRRIVTTNSIMVKNLVKGDTGNYGCNATNSLGYVYRDVYLNVLAVPPEIEIQPGIEATVDNRNVTLVCKVFGTPKPQVKWIKDGSNLSGGRFKVTDDGSLEITRVIPTDAGDYQCYASNKFGTKSANGTLIVKKPTKIYEHPEDYEVAAESPAIFRCSAEADTHLELKINWLKNGELIDHSDSRFLKMYDNSLHISKTIELDSGEYTCVAFTDLDSDESTAMLIVQNAPNAPKLIRVECFETSATVFWESQGDNRSPILFYTIQYNTTFTPDKWNIAYEKVPSSEHTYTVTMTPWANYSFRVIAWNKIGKSLASDHSQVCTTQEDVPYKNPENVEGKGTGPDNMVIRWTQMPEIEHNAPNFHYQVSWKNDIEGETWQNTEIKNWTQTSLVIPDTPVFQRYRIKVIAINRVGQANVQAREVIGYSGEGKPTEAPVTSSTFITKQPQDDISSPNITALEGKPEIIEQPGVVVTVEGGKARFVCAAVGVPTPVVEWYKGSEYLNSGRFFVLDDNSLEIKNVESTDDGEYQCRSLNKFGTTTANGTLIVKQATSIYDWPSSYERPVGDSITFSCAGQNDDLELKIDWLKDGEIIDFTDSRFVENHWIYPESTRSELTISNIVDSDSGKYTCVVYTYIDGAVATGTLLVQDIPKTPKITKVECFVNSGFISWESLDDTRAPIKSFSIESNTSSTQFEYLHPLNIGWWESSFYVDLRPWANYTFRVIAHNIIGKSPPSEYSQVCTTQADVPYKNPISVYGEGTAPNNMVVHWTPMEEIDHNAPNLRYRVSWKKDLTSDAWHDIEITDWKQSSLEILDTPVFQRYRIKVIAFNEVGQSNGPIHEVIGYSGEGEPTEAPDSFTVIEVTGPKQALVRCNKVSNDSVNGYLEGYKVEMWTEDDPELKNQIHYGIDAGQISLDNLKPATKYFAHIKVINKRYNGPASNTVSFTTLEDVPGMVESLDVVPLGSSAFWLSWKPPLEPNGKITGYNIYYQRLNRLRVYRQNRLEISDPGIASVKLTGFKLGTNYVIQIRAKTSAGEGKVYTIRKYIRTIEHLSIVPDTPNFTCERIANDTDVRVQWRPAKRNPGLHFFARYRKEGESNWETTGHEVNEDYLVIRGLDPNSTYEIGVSAVDGEYVTDSESQVI